MGDRFDVVVVGGGAAGLAGALALARARRRVLVVDAGEPRNAPAAGVHNYLGREGMPPGELLAVGRAEVTAYGGRFVSGRVDAVTRDDQGFVVTIDGERVVSARRLLVTTGLVDELPEVPGLTERWGRDVLHCPYCHGWEVRDRRIGVLAAGPLAVHAAKLWRQWSPQVRVLLNGGPPPGPQEAEQLAARGVAVLSEPVVAVESVEDRLVGVRLASGELVELDAVVVPVRMTARSALLESLGLEPVDVEHAGQVVGRQIPADATGATAVPGVWVAGNVAEVSAQVIRAAAAGMTAAGMINMDLVEEDTRDAVAEHRRQREAMFTEAAWEERYRSKPAVWSGRPNPQLVTEVSEWAPGRALDVGSGEGADAVWLAERGWQVHAVDISTVALARAADHAQAVGAEVAARIEWIHADLSRWSPTPGAYDLVSAQFMQLPPPQRWEVFGRLAEAVAPDGRLLIVGHHPTDLRTAGHRMHFPEMMYTAEQVAAELDPTRFEVLTTATRPRTVAGADGRDVVHHDAVLLARRR
ncbi:bifunctional NAD(P)/FAD-dependent oxidoreductase/class I SAM-dependent methyltransferase [Micromonospora lutea]|nr:bifunctional NAD(P)/FAD-dependent oxidoreductase/class I SAM-dependent methyltransferase [Micromonospora lutea]